MSLRNLEFCPLDAHRLSVALCRQVLPCPFETQTVGVVVPTTDPVPSSGPAISHGHMHFITCLVLSDSLCPPLILVTEPGGRMTSCASRPCLAVCVWGGTLYSSWGASVKSKPSPAFSGDLGQRCLPPSPHT